MLEKGTVVLTDKGFGITDLYLAKGLHHNRPPLKYNPHMIKLKLAKTLTLPNYIRRMRGWAIINAYWPSNRIDLLGYVHKVLAHVVNIFKKPIGPKESDEECKASDSVGSSTT